MSKLSRREFVYMMAVLGAAPVFANSHGRITNTENLEDYYKLKPHGNVRLLHMTDSHAQLLPVYFREPSVNLGFHGNYGKPPHIVGEITQAKGTGKLKRLVLFTTPPQGVDQQLGSGSSMLQFIFGDALLVG